MERKRVNWDTIGAYSHKEKYGNDQLRIIKNEYFKKITLKRKKEIFKLLDELGNCSNKSHYFYRSKQVQRLFREIRKYIDVTEEKFKRRA
jgi:hypothetical protein